MDPAKDETPIVGMTVVEDSPAQESSNPAQLVSGTNDQPKRAIGISFGTKNVCSSSTQMGYAVIYFDINSCLVPACVSFTSSECLVGAVAQDQLTTNPENTIYDCKRLLGKRFNDPTVQDYIKEWPFKVIDDNNRPKYQVTFRGELVTFFPEEIAALLLKHAKEMTERNMCKEVNEAVLTIPVEYTKVQEQALIDAANMAGIKVLQLLHESVAAAICYSLGKFQNVEVEDKKLAVISAGCGFLDVSLISYQQRVFHCAVSKGRSDLDITRTIVRHFATKFRDTHGVELLEDVSAHVHLRKFCEELKCSLGVEAEVPFRIDTLLSGVQLEGYLSRDELNAMVGSVAASMKELFTQCLEEAGWTPDSIDECVMVGGCSHIPAIQEQFHQLGGKDTLAVILDYPEVRAVVGAAMRASSLKGQDEVGLQDIVSLDVTSREVPPTRPPGKCRPLARYDQSIPNWVKEYGRVTGHHDPFPIQIYEGSHRSSHNLEGRYYVTEPCPDLRGPLHLRVTLDVDPRGNIVAWQADAVDENRTGAVRNESASLSQAEFTTVKTKFSEAFPPAPIPELKLEEVGSNPHPPVVNGNAQQANGHPVLNGNQNGNPVANGHGPNGNARHNVDEGAEKDLREIGEDHRNP